MSSWDELLQCFVMHTTNRFVYQFKMNFLAIGKVDFGNVFNSI